MFRFFDSLTLFHCKCIAIAVTGRLVATVIIKLVPQSWKRTMFVNGISLFSRKMVLQTQVYLDKIGDQST